MRNCGGGRRTWWAASVVVVGWLALFEGLLVPSVAAGRGSFDYKDALAKSLIFLEAQRSGPLPSDNRIPWRGDSALDDGKLANVDLVGGYYDAGDNVKYGLPMAFTVTTLSWAAVFYEKEIREAGEMENLHSAIRWGTDYFLKACVKKNSLFVQVGDPEEDHQCWIRPENMKTKRTVLKIDDNDPGTEIAAETSAAMAASSIVFRKVDKHYSRRLLNKAKLLFEFSRKHKGTYDGECPFYCSFSGYNDELLWAATWLYKATLKSKYMDFIKEQSISATVAEFSWDLKYAGAQVLLSKMHFEGQAGLESFKKSADGFVCSVIPESPYNQVFITPGGMVHLREGANSQYVVGTAMLFSVYSDILAQHNQQVTCGDTKITPKQLMTFAKQQMDYLLGNNPQGKSYMVGFGEDSPKQAHHRGASVPTMRSNEVINCAMTFAEYFNVARPNLHELTGAIVGGPDRQDNFVDLRSKSSYTEPVTYANSLAVGVLAKLIKFSG